jgi:hypothetical protein
MAKGGARARSGPAPDPQALRRDRPSDGDWTTLPAEGRKGKPPAWPLTKATRRESTLWVREWRRPQAVMWERLGLEVEVALYVRSLAGAESPLAAVNLRTLVKQQQEALGISLPGLARNRWRIGHVDQAPAPRAPVGRSARERFVVVAGGRDD